MLHEVRNLILFKYKTSQMDGILLHFFLILEVYHAYVLDFIALLTE